MFDHDDVYVDGMSREEGGIVVRAKSFLWFMVGMGVAMLFCLRHM